MSDAIILRDLSPCVKDIQESHGQVSKRSDKKDMSLHEGKLHSCNNDNTTLTDGMIQRILMLENKEKETNQEISRLKQCFEKLHEWIKHLELHKADIVLNLDKTNSLDESLNDSTHKLPTDTSLTKEDLEINQHSICLEKHEVRYESENIEVFDNDFNQETEVPDALLDTIQEVADNGPYSHPSCRENDALMDQPDASKLNTKSVLIETDFKTENVLSQEERQYLESINIWNVRASDERRLAQESGLLHSRGIQTVICVDTSGSLLHDYGRSQVNTFVKDYLNGLEKSATTIHTREESVALVTFGNETHVPQRLTQNYKKVMQVYEKVKFGGPSPMYGGLAMAIAAAESVNGTSANGNGMTINTKIVLITDGRPTDSCMVQGPDAMDNQINDDTQHHVLSKVSELADRPYLKLFVVPVGNANTKFLDLMISVADGKMLRHDEGKQLSRRLEEGKQSKTGSFSKMFKRVSNDDYYHESTDKTLPQVGSRVVRGPDWIHNNQDGGGPGTIIGHSSDMTGMIRVEWDRNAFVNNYRYSAELGYAVLLIDNPREIIDGSINRIAVGFVVKPGTHFNYKGTNVNRKDRGVVLKVLTSAEYKVLVRWNNFKRVRGEYSYGCQDFYEVELCQTDTSEHEMASVDNYSKSCKTKSIKNKNK